MASPETLWSWPELTGSWPELVGSKPELPTVSPELLGSTPEPTEVQPELTGGKLELHRSRRQREPLFMRVVQRRPELPTVTPELTGSKPELPGATPETQGAPPELQGGRPELVGRTPEALVDVGTSEVLAVGVGRHEDVEVVGEVDEVEEDAGGQWHAKPRRVAVPLAERTRPLMRPRKVGGTRKNTRVHCSGRRGRLHIPYWQPGTLYYRQSGGGVWFHILRCMVCGKVLKLRKIKIPRDYCDPELAGRAIRYPSLV